jgi:hypothetical protein
VQWSVNDNWADGILLAVPRQCRFLNPLNDISQAQRRFDRIAPIVLALAGIALGYFFANQLTHIPSGYVAPNVTLSVLASTVLLILLGAILLLHWRTHRLGVGLIGAGLLTLTTYALAGRVLLTLDRIPWAPPAVQLVPGQQARVILRFRGGVTQQQVNDFVSSKLSSLPDWADSLAGLPANERSGQLGLALNLSVTAYGGGRSALESRMLAENVSAFMVATRRDPRVSTVELQKYP